MAKTAFSLKPETQQLFSTRKLAHHSTTLIEDLHEFNDFSNFFNLWPEQLLGGVVDQLDHILSVDELTPTSSYQKLITLDAIRHGWKVVTAISTCRFK